MKSPHNQRPDDQARADTEKFIAKYAGRSAGERARAAPSAKSRESRRAKAKAGARA